MNTLKSVMLLAVLSAILIWAGGAIGGKNGALIALMIAGVMNFISYWWSDKIVLSMYGAKEVTHDEAPELYSTVQELAHHATRSA
jgi:heat shock protein HtpX